MASDFDPNRMSAEAGLGASGLTAHAQTKAKPSMGISEHLSGAGRSVGKEKAHNADNYSVSEAVRLLKRIEKPLAQNTVDLHNNSLKTLLKLFENKFLDQITRSMIEDFKAGRAREFKKGSKTQLVSVGHGKSGTWHAQEDPEHGYR